MQELVHIVVAQAAHEIAEEQEAEAVRWLESGCFRDRLHFRVQHVVNNSKNPFDVDAMKEAYKWRLEA